MPFNYTNNVPQAETAMNVTQPQILENFQAIKELVAINHIDFNLPGFGTHNFLTMPNTTTPTASGTDLNVYVKATPAGPNTSEIFGLYPTGVEFQISGLQQAATGTSGTGWSVFPSGIIMKWGTGTGTSAAQSVIYPTGAGIPAFTQTPGFVKVTLTSSYLTQFLSTSIAQTNAGAFQIQAWGANPSGATYTFNWFAIGV